MEYFLYEETNDDSGGSMERLHGIKADTFSQAKAELEKNPRYLGIDCYDGKNWHYDVEGEVVTHHVGEE